jgi:hypothetical protein
VFLLFIKDWYNQDALRNLTAIKNEMCTDHPPQHQAPAASKVAWPVTLLLFEDFVFLYEAALVMRVPSNAWHNIQRIR